MSPSISLSEAPSRLADQVYRPQPKQESWHSCPAYESGFGGAKFGGKSLGLVMEATRYSWHPRYRGIIFRRSYTRLEELIDRAWQWYPGLGARGREGGKDWVFPSGGKVLFRHCQNEEDKRAYHGHEYQFMAFDQLEEFSESQYTFLLGQNRTGVPELEPYTRSTFNPGGVGHGWVKARFVDHGTRECGPWTPVNDANVDLQPRCFHFASINDNPAGEQADPTYRQRLQNLPEVERRALLEGDWDVFAGQFFTEWRRAIHVCAPGKIPPEWPRWHATDYGLSAPSCTLWAARSPTTGRIYVYRERYERERTLDQQALKIRLWSGEERYRNRLLDPSCWNRESNGRSIADQFTEFGVPMAPANNDRSAGWAKLHELLAYTEALPPRLQVFSTCANLIRTLPSLIHDDKDVEDVDTDGEDHAADTLRYLLMGMDVQADQRRGSTRQYALKKRPEQR